MSGMTVRRIVSVLLGATLVSGTGIGLAAVPAGAEIASARVSAAKNVVPDTNYATLHFLDGNGYHYACDGESIYPVNARVNFVANGCHVQVLLFIVGYTNPWCTSPRANSTPPYGATSTSLFITTNTGGCDGFVPTAVRGQRSHE